MTFNRRHGLSLLAVFTLAFGGCRQPPESAIDLGGLRRYGGDWEIVDRDSSIDRGSITLHQDQWAMFFLHWRPLPEEPLSGEYARNLLLNFWGPDMPFDVRGDGGTATVNGHRAYYVDGNLSGSEIQTRFVVWNCPETTRQIIADVNINRGTGAPDSLFDLQIEMASTVSCNGSPVDAAHSELNQRYGPDEFGISFSMPSNWRTHSYTSSEWFPNGPSETNGTLWTLLTDSEKHVEYFWWDGEVETSQEALRMLASETERTRSGPYDGTVTISDLTFRSFAETDSYVVANGEFSYSFRLNDREETEPYRYRALLWNYGGRTHLLLAGIVLRTEIWQRPTDLAPSDATFDAFFADELLPNVAVLPGEYP